MKAIAKGIATFFGSGYFPIAPGTAGALLACVVVWPLLTSYSGLGHSWDVCDTTLSVAIIIFTILGIICTNMLESEWGHDPSKIVVDEAVGVWIAMLCTPFTMVNLILSFVLFRIFDIWKPFGIRKLESLNGGLGVMADDILAGLYANLVLQVILYSGILDKIF